MNGLTVTGKDQFGSSYDLTGLSKSWTVRTGTGFSTVNGTILIPLSAGSGTVTLTVYGKESNPAAFTVQVAASGEPRVLLVDRRGMTSGAYPSIAAAVASSPVLKPGDIISLVPGSGPYHETVKIHASGVPGNPIIFEGNGELISGFTPFQFTQETNGQWTYTLPAPIPNSLPDGKSSTFRHLVAYNGQRLLLDQPSGQNAGIFTSDYAVLSSDGSKLILNPDEASPNSGWEISTLMNGVEIVTPDSYQTYRNVWVTGVQNDGFNIHGTGTGLVFENIKAFNNFDEGFSSHDLTNSTIEGGEFWGNENGIYNQSRDTVSFTANNVKVYSNIGYGVATQMGTNSFSNVQVWDNGISNLRVGGRVFTSHVVTYESRWSQRPWVGYQESQNYKFNQEVKPYAYSEYVKAEYPITKTGTAPTVLPASQLPPFKGALDDWRHIYFSAAELCNPEISGPEADPDGDGLDNFGEYEAGLNPKVPDNLADITPPAAPIIMEPADNSVIGNPKPTFRGTAEAGSTVTVSVYGALAGITTADGSGNWSHMPVEALSEGFHTVSATATDEGATGAAAPLIFTLRISTNT
ncbi:Ig-like domain-containing protein [Paenibacillus sp. HJGM_3]|uniref:Ig-like domain-containing protein n=1 Tax=Paenibacillus sp. HJGM_3 TaxID=3379816 RepID=UPI00385D6CD7